MRIFLKVLAATAVLLLGCQVSAEELDRVLLPMTVQNVPGAFGTRWFTTTMFTNVGLADISVWYLQPVGGLTVIAARTHGYLPVSQSGAESPGQYIYVDHAHVGDLVIQSRVRALSDSGGAVLPAVHMADFRPDAVHLIDVPVNANSRTLLRIYDSDARDGAQVRVSVHGVYGALLDERIATLVVPFSVGPDPDRPRSPAYAQIPIVVTPEAESYSVFIDVVPLSPDVRIWAFAATVDNMTQAQTFVTPLH